MAVRIISALALAVGIGACAGPPVIALDPAPAPQVIALDAADMDVPWLGLALAESAYVAALAVSEEGRVAFFTLADSAGPASLRAGRHWIRPRSLDPAAVVLDGRPGGLAGSGVRRHCIGPRAIEVIIPDSGITRPAPPWACGWLLASGPNAWWTVGPAPRSPIDPWTFHRLFLIASQRPLSRAVIETAIRETHGWSDPQVLAVALREAERRLASGAPGQH